MSEVAERVATVRFAREAVATVIGEIPPLMRKHWEEVGHYRDIPIDPDFEHYAQAERAGKLRIYTVRGAWRDGYGVSVPDALVGYATYLLGTALHYKDVITAQQGTLFLDPDYRRGARGTEFIRWTEKQLRADGVQLIVQHVKAKQNPRRARAFCAWLERDGYELQDYLLTKRL